MKIRTIQYLLVGIAIALTTCKITLKLPDRYEDTMQLFVIVIILIVLPLGKGRRGSK